MEYIKTTRDEQIIQRDMQTNKVCVYLKQINFYKFAVGDILIREEKRGDQWILRQTETGVPFRWMYVFENELGIGYVRRLKVKGDYAGDPICITEFDPKQTRFSLDPEYGDHILLNSEAQFDPKTAYKEVQKKKNLVARKNKKLLRDTSSLVAVQILFNSLKPGDKFWYGRRYSTLNEFEFIKFTTIQVKLISDRAEDSIEYKSTITGYTHKTFLGSFMNSKITLEKPFTVAEQL